MICLLLGHDKEYVALRSLHVRSHSHTDVGSDHEYCKCHHGRYLDHSCPECKREADNSQEARWVCRRGRCPAMGNKIITRSEGLFKIEFGLLVPDKKGWSNFDDETASSTRGGK